MSNLPSGWLPVTLQDVAIWSSGGTPSRANPSYYSGAIPWLKTGELGPRVIYSAEEHISDAAIDGSSAKLFPKGSVAIAMYGATIGKTSILGIDAATNQACAVGIPDATSSEFLYYFLLSQEKSFVDAGKGGAQPNISQGIVKGWPMLLPPRAEQTRIVAKLEELLSDLDAGMAELKAAQKKLGQYRQSLLKAAVEGALTAEWRAARTPLAPCGRGAGGEGCHGQAEALACSEPSCTVDTVSPSPQPLPHQEGGATTVDENWLQARARELRQAQTPQEQALWQHLRAKRFEGYKFRRQQPLGHYIVDFVCFAQKLIVELDGSQHAIATQYDAQRDAWLKQQGFRVLRFWNNQWTAQPESVLEAIWLTLQQEPPLSSCPPLPNPSPSRGEGLETETGAALTPLSLDGIGAGGEGETGAQLLERILTERRVRWEAKQLAKFAEQGKTPPRDWQKKYPEPVQPDTTDLPELPEGWVWATVDQIAEVFLGKMLDKTKHTTGTKLPYLRNVNVRWGSIEVDDVYEMFFDSDELERYGLIVGDVLVCEGGEPGRAAICKKEHEQFKYQKALHRVRMFNLYEPELLIAFLEFAAKTGRLAKTFTGSTINHFTKESFIEMCLPLPGLAEQKIIVDSIAASLGSICEQEFAIEHSLKQSTAQRQNILRAAFAGQLVPQDPNDESASVLLERIRLERATQTANKKPRGRKAKEGV